MNGVIARRCLTTLVSRSAILSKERQAIFRNLNQKRLCTYFCAKNMLDRVQYSNDFYFRQLFDEKSWTYSYLLADKNSKEAVIIDPGEFLTIFSILKQILASYVIDKKKK